MFKIRPIWSPCLDEMIRRLETHSPLGIDGERPRCLNRESLLKGKAQYI
jgi:hypothetical protein